MFTPLSSSWNSSLKLEFTYWVYSSEPNTYWKKSSPVVDVKSKRKELVVPPALQLPWLLGPAGQSLGQPMLVNFH